MGQHKCVLGAYSMAPPYFEGNESFVGLGLPQFQSFMAENLERLGLGLGPLWGPGSGGVEVTGHPVTPHRTAPSNPPLHSKTCFGVADSKNTPTKEYPIIPSNSRQKCENSRKTSKTALFQYSEKNHRPVKKVQVTKNGVLGSFG